MLMSCCFVVFRLSVFFLLRVRDPAASLDKLIRQLSLGHFDLLMTLVAAHWQVSIQEQHCKSVCVHV